MIKTITLVTFIFLLSPGVSFSEGLDCGNPEFPIFENGLYGAISNVGKVLIEPKYKVLEMMPFSAVARCKEPFPAKLPDGKFGFISRNGADVLPPQFDSASCFRDDVAVVSKSDKFFMINSKGEKIGDDWDSMELSDTGEPIAARRGKEIFYISTSGKVIFKSPTEPLIVEADTKKFEDLYTYAFRDGLATIRKGQKWGSVDKEGKVTIPVQSDAPIRFDRGFAILRLGEAFSGRQGVIDKSGKYVLDLAKVTIMKFADWDNLFQVQENGTYNFQIYDPSKKKYLPGSYNDTKGCRDKLCIVANSCNKNPSGKCWIAIDYNGKVKMRYPNEDIGFIGLFSEGLSGYSTYKKESTHPFSMGFIDINGKMKIKAAYDDASGYFECGVAKVTIEKSTGFIDKSGKFIWNPR